MSNITQVLGTVAMEPKGEYDSSVTYEKLNTVLYNDSTYMAKELVQGETPSTSSKWQLIGGGLTREDIVDNLDSNDATKMLSAKQGKILKEKIVNPKALVCVTKVDNGDSYSLVLSRSFDGINFGNLVMLGGISIPYGDHNIAMNFCYTHNRFYVLTSQWYWYSSDLKNWTKVTFDSTYSAAFIYDDVLYYHNKDSNTSITSDVVSTTYPFSIKYCALTFNDDGTFTLGTKNTLISSSLSQSHIDPTVVEYNNKTYFACKDEIHCNIKLYEMEGNVLTDTGFVHRGIGIEAPKLIPASDGLYIYADPYGLQTNYENTTNVSYDRGLSVRMTAIGQDGINNDSLLTVINNSYEWHPAFSLVEDAEAVRIIDSLDFSQMLSKPIQYYKQVTLNSSTSNEVISVINHPLRPLYITGNTSNNVAYLRFTKLFEDSSLIIRFDPSSGTTFRPAQGVNSKTDATSTDVIIRNNEIITAPIYNTSNNTFVYLPIEQYEYRRQLETLPTNQSIQTSLNQKFLKGNTVNFFIISGYGTDITVNLLPTASNFFGEYYKQNNNFGHIKLYRIGDAVIEYQATISNGTLSNWAQTQGS